MDVLSCLQHLSYLLIYWLIREHWLYTTLQNVLQDTLSALYTIQLSSLNIWVMINLCHHADTCSQKTSPSVLYQLKLNTLQECQPILVNRMEKHGLSTETVYKLVVWRSSICKNQQVFEIQRLWSSRSSVWLFTVCGDPQCLEIYSSESCSLWLSTVRN